MKTSELTGAALDWAVEKAKGTYWSENGYFCFDNPKRYDSNPEWRYSTDWSPAGPIIEREMIHLRAPEDACKPDGTVVVPVSVWYARITDGSETWVQNGPDPLTAAMRCYIANKLGDEVDIPKELQ